MEIDQEIMADVEEDSMETPPDGYEGMITLVVSARISRTLATDAEAVLLASVDCKGKYRDCSCCGGFGCRSLRERSHNHLHAGVPAHTIWQDPESGSESRVLYGGPGGGPPVKVKPVAWDAPIS